MSETTVLVNTFCGGIQLVIIYESLVQEWVAQVAQGIVDTVPGIPVLIKIPNLFSKCTTLTKSRESRNFYQVTTVMVWIQIHCREA